MCMRMHQACLRVAQPEDLCVPSHAFAVICNSIEWIWCEQGMGRYLALIRRTENQEVARMQRQELDAYVERESIHLDAVLELDGGPIRVSRQKRIDWLTQQLQPGDMLLVAALEDLGRSIGEIIALIEQVLAMKTTIFTVREALLLTGDSNDLGTRAMAALIALLAETERNLVSQRTKDVLAARKASGAVLGKPKGTIQASIYDKDRDRIRELLATGVSQRRILKEFLGYGTPNSLSRYIRTRGLQAPR